jgi:hypothetical protein
MSGCLNVRPMARSKVPRLPVVWPRGHVPDGRSYASDATSTPLRSRRRARFTATSEFGIVSVLVFVLVSTSTFTERSSFAPRKHDCRYVCRHVNEDREEGTKWTSSRSRISKYSSWRMNWC